MSIIYSIQFIIWYTVSPSEIWHVTVPPLIWIKRGGCVHGRNWALYLRSSDIRTQQCCESMRLRHGRQHYRFSQAPWQLRLNSEWPNMTFWVVYGCSARTCRALRFEPSHWPGLHGWTSRSNARVWLKFLTQHAQPLLSNLQLDTRFFSMEIWRHENML